ncbi:MAG: MBL fold metallo-hydrolase [Planctomycetota bacterium]
MNEPRQIRIEPFALGDYQTNCYIVHDATQCFVADCGDRPEPLLDRLDELGLEPEAFVLTHAHLDHIAGLHAARRRYAGSPIWIHPLEAPWLLDTEQNLSALAGQPVTAPPSDRTIEHGESLDLVGGPWEVRHAPGHSPGSVVLFSASLGIAISGDTVFAGSIGRTDFPGCDFETLEASIRREIYSLPEDTTLLPGHGPPTTVGRERSTNPFVKAN